jgi:RNA-binding protein
MALATKDKQKLKGKAHKLKPIVTIGQHGLTETVNMEIDRALNDHELFKIRINSEDREARKELFAAACKYHQAELIQTIGKIGVIYRKNISG